MLLAVALLIPLGAGLAFRIAEPGHYLGSAMLRSGLWQTLLVSTMPLTIYVQHLGVPFLKSLGNVCLNGTPLALAAVAALYTRRMREAATQVLLEPD